ncbi:hypothetical protein DAPPUDRAFT_329402 [Daphnia pulex]|uniref:Uncharacterized protein n=1 Tax=Daphnia pulex TaxID=6669 RepID=E9HGG8_DAPPU|nr:hypothetical protein DAPPUDRAFT_329402 [Daphnia pulex]|eukprot:EFX69170.1 hypothetical protein DAPPUDRAFT_329402 [Daphnia pulex]
MTFSVKLLLMVIITFNYCLVTALYVIVNHYLSKELLVANKIMSVETYEYLLTKAKYASLYYKIDQQYPGFQEPAHLTENNDDVISVEIDAGGNNKSTFHSYSAHYYEFFPNVGPKKTFRNLQAIWQKITSELNHLGIRYRIDSFSKTFLIVPRYKTAKKKHVSASSNNEEGRKRKAVPFEEEFSKIKSIDDSLDPEVLQGVGVVKHSQIPKKNCKQVSSDEEEIIVEQDYDKF